MVKRWLKRLLCRHRVVLTGYAKLDVVGGSAAEAWKRCVGCGKVGFNCVIVPASYEVPWLAVSLYGDF